MLYLLHAGGVLVFDYTNNNIINERKSFVRDLGVLFDDRMSFNCHCEALSKRSTRLVGFICRASREFRSPSSLLLLYKSLVLSQLEYASVVWSPQYNVYIDLLESTQRRFLRTLTLRFGRKRELTTYADRQRFFNLNSLENRRKVHDFTYLHRVFSGSISTTLTSDIYIRVPDRSARRECLFSVPFCNNNVSFHNPIFRMCREYNALLKRTDGVPDICQLSIGSWKSFLKNNI